MNLTLQPRQPFDWYKWFIIGCIIVISIIIASILPKCEGEKYEPLDGVIKDSIVKQKVRKDSVSKEVVIKDSIRIVYITKWRTLKGQIDTLPCPEVLTKVITLTDSIISIDSSEIASLKAEILIDGLIIANQDTIIKNDSIALKRVTKKLKWQKVKTKAVAIGMGVLLGSSLLIR